MIDLTQYNTPIEFNGGANPIYKIEINHSLFIFKEANPTSENMHIVEPLISQYLAKSPCTRFVPYYPARFEDKVGVLSKYFLENNEQEITLLQILQLIYSNNLGKKLPLDYNFSKEEFNTFWENYEKIRKKDPMYFNHNLPEILSAVKKICEIYNIDNDFQSLKQTLTETFVYDYFLGNEDRNWQNLSFIIKNKNGKLSISQTPMFDHEYCLNMYYFYDKYIQKEHNPFENIIGFHNSLKPHSCSKDTEPDWSNIAKFMVQDIIEESHKNPQVAEQVKYCLNFDANKFIDDFEKNENIKINKLCKEIILYSFQSKIDFYKKQEKIFNLGK